MSTYYNYPDGSKDDPDAIWNERDYDEEKCECIDCKGTGIDIESSDLCFSCSGEGQVYIDRRGDYDED